MKPFTEDALWPPQRAAADFVRKRCGTSPAEFDSAESVRSILIRMPTGTGKSGVIATISQTGILSAPVLVLTPSTALRDQLADDIKARFWRHLNVNPPPTGLKVVTFKPSTVAAAIAEARTTPAILVSTIQSLESIWRDQNQATGSKTRREAYGRLRDVLKYVIVDEGHREPAEEWSKAVRSLRRVVILFTATPYRNDHRAFNVGDGDAFAYTHENAEKERYVRGLQFKAVASNLSASQFVSALVLFYDSDDFRSQIPGDADPPRVIVRCEQAESIKAISDALSELGRSVVAVHTGFHNHGHFRNAVPREPVPGSKKPRDSCLDAVFWVHQNMLLEGIDRTECCLLALYEPLRNGRSLVQQVGRVLRNPTRERGAVAFVFSDPRHRQKEIWELYRKYEASFEANPDLYEKRALYDATVALTPETWLYEAGLFRYRLDIEKGPLAHQISYRQSANVFRVRRRFNAAKFEQQMLEALESLDLDVRARELPDGTEGRVERPDNRTWFIPFVRYDNPPLFFEHYLFQADIGFVLWRRRGRHLFYTSSIPGVPEFFDEHVSPEDPALLQRLFSGKAGAWLTGVSLLNTDLGEHSVRRRSLGARNVGSVAPALNDHMQVCSTATGFIRDSDGPAQARYVGFRRGRVSQPNARRERFAQFVQWLDDLGRKLDGSASVAPAFERFASFVSVPEEPEAENILIDLSDGADLFAPSRERLEALGAVDGNSQDGLELDDLCVNVVDGAFEIKLKGDPENFAPYRATIRFDHDKARYVLQCPELDRHFIRETSRGRKMKAGVSAYLTQEQCFRVIPKTAGVVYAHRRFYQPRLDLSGSQPGGRVALRSVFEPVPALAVASSEKGTKCTSTGWQTDSVFGMIDQAARPQSRGQRLKALSDRLRGVDWLVCDDVVLTEVADFIALEEDRRVILIHAKGFRKRKLRSASAYHEVCMQAIKNLEALSPYGEFPDTHTAHWTKPWSVPNTEGPVEHRIRRFPPGKTRSGSEFYRALVRAIRNPTVAREVWLVLGKGFSLREFDDARKKQRPPAEIVQIAYSVQSTWSTAASVGCSLRVFCSP